MADDPETSPNKQIPNEADFLSISTEMRELWLTRGKQRNSADAGLAILYTELRAHIDRYDSGDLADQRLAVACTLLAVENFLAEQGFNRLLLKVLMRPFDALELQENNQPDPMFAERKRSGAPNKWIDDYQRMGVLAALTQYWIDTHPDGGTIPSQIAAAARKFRGKWFGTVTPKELKNARDLVSCEGPSHHAVQSAQRTKAELHVYSERWGRQHALSMMINHLNIMPPSPALGNGTRQNAAKSRTEHF